MAKARRSVLWAEDNLGDQMLIREALAEMPDAPEVVFVADGVEFLAALDRVRPDQAVLDLRMPRIGGLEALRRVRADPRWAGLAVAIFSAGDQPQETAACQALGAAAVFSKPVNFQEFTRTVHRLFTGEADGRTAGPGAVRARSALSVA